MPLDAILPWVALVVTVAAMVAIKRGLDVRLVLFLAGLILVSLAGNPVRILETFQTYLGRGDIIGPICTAMGYAWVLKATGVDREMVALMMKPMRHIRVLLIPGGCAVGFVTNMAMTSQTACAAAVGPILIPILTAAGYHPVIAGATLLTGVSIGGNLFNPGEPDIIAVHASTDASIASVINAAVLPNLLSFGIAVAVMTVLAWRYPRSDGSGESAPKLKPSVLKALLPPLPVILLFLLQPGLDLFPALTSAFPSGVHVSSVMLFCTGVVLLVTRQNASHLTREFFEGMGYAFARVISLIVAAACFIAGLSAAGVIDTLASVISDVPALGPVLTWILAFISGSGTAPSVSFSQAVLPTVAATDLSGAVDLGVLGAIGASIGRTMSPVAAVVLFTATLVNLPPTQIIGIVWKPMVAALLGVLLFSIVA